ncbi:hypothetical protein PWT90_07643 [Aphanocladium album]|nr:hypothetical protein PWT90_07643 [Aphanocladium album]
MMKPLRRTLCRSRNDHGSLRFAACSSATTRPIPQRAGVRPPQRLSHRSIHMCSSRLQLDHLTPAAEPSRNPSASTQLSPAHELAEELGRSSRAKWGWITYRCTYGDDAAWERFKTLVTRDLRGQLDEADVPRAVRDAAGWIFVEDQAALDGASRDTLRQRFQSWAAEAEVAERLPGPAAVLRRGDGGQPPAGRYRYFIQVDEECLRSVVETPEHPGWVHLVRCVEGLDYNQSPEHLRAVEEYKRELEDEDEFDAEDCMLLATSTLHKGFYLSLSNEADSWHCFYSRPPNLVVW